MNRMLWIVQIALALIFLAAGSSKLLMPDAMLAAQFLPSPPFMRLIGALELLGTLGLVVPGLARVRPGLTPLAAAGLVIIMGGAVITSLMSGAAGALIPLVLGLLAAAVAYGRWRVSPPRQPARASVLRPAG